ncbi:hypothetical protein STFR1_50371 [Bacillus vallismortis]
MNKVPTTLAILTNVPAIATRIVKKPLGMKKPIGISPIKVKTIKHWYTPDMILTIKLPKKDMTNGGINKHTTIPIDIMRIIGSSNEMTCSPGEFLAATSMTTIDIINVNNTRKNLFNIVIAPFLCVPKLYVLFLKFFHNHLMCLNEEYAVKSKLPQPLFIIKIEQISTVLTM